MKLDQNEMVETHWQNNSVSNVTYAKWCKLKMVNRNNSNNKKRGWNSTIWPEHQLTNVEQVVKNEYTNIFLIFYSKNNK